MQAPQPAGWYYADGDPPGTHRYWDGELWIGEPRVAAPAPQPAPYPSAPMPLNYPEESQATTAVVLAVLSLVLCGILAPFGWSMAQKELDAIGAGRRDPANRGTAQTAKVLGIVGTVLLVLGALFFVFFFLFFAVATTTSLG